MEEQEGLQEQTAAGTEATEEEKEREETGQKGRKKEENRGGIKAWLIVLLIALVAATSSLTTLAVSTYVRVKKGGSYTITQEYYDYLVRYKRLFEVEELLKEEHLYEVDDQKFVDYAIKGLVAATGDRYSAYMTPDEFRQVMTNNSGEKVGIGIVLSKKDADALVTIVRVYPGTPGEAAGLQKGDQFFSVEGESVADLDTSSLAELLAGEKGTMVNFTVLRNGRPVDVTVTRDVFTVDRVLTKTFEPDIGYIQITEFTGNAKERFNEELDRMLDEGIQALIIDLRDNPGGYVEDVCDMTDRLLPAGTIVYTQDRAGNQDVQKSDAECIDIPIVVLVNGNSASASEIMTGALQDYGKATIVGTRTFGKGLVQMTVPFVSDGAAVKYTFAEYFTPNGRNINGVGIEPDVVVELEEATSVYFLTEENDAQLAKGLEILREELGWSEEEPEEEMEEEEELPLAG